MTLALISGIAPGVWAAETDEILETAFNLLEERAENGK